MIKKLLGLLIVFIGCIGFSSATFQTVGLTKQQSSFNSNYDLGFLKGGTVLTDFLGQSRSVLAFDNNLLFWWHVNGRPYFYGPSWQGFFSYIDSCPEITYTGDNFVFDMSQCSRTPISGLNYIDYFKGFFSKVNNDDFVYYDYRNSAGGVNYSYYYYSTIICWSSSEIGRSLCFDYNNCYYGGPNGGYNRCSMSDGGGFEDSLGYTGLTFGSVPSSVIGYAPGTNNYNNNGYVPGDSDSFSSGNNQVIPSDIDNYISYWEDLYGRNEKMCYVGIGESFLDIPYLSGGISFSEGRGATIYGLYYHLYSGFGTDKIFNVGSFVNAWTNNLYNSYKSDPYYFVYNGPDQNTSIEYGGDFPFLNKSAGIYFMADYLNSYDNTENNGQNVIIYCDMKLNYNNYENGSLDFSDLEDSISDVVKKNVQNHTNDNNKGKDGYSVPNLGSGSIWDNLVQSGYNIPKDLNPTDLFSDFYSKTDSLITNFNPATKDGILPLWIIYPMLFLILFRVMRH